MKTQVGSCPKCGAPIYVPSIWHGITPPPNEYTCGCSQESTIISAYPLSNISSGTVNIDQYGYPKIIDTLVFSDKVEVVYRREPYMSYTSYPPITPEPQIYKIVFSCKNGKWHQSEKIMGRFIPASNEGYQF